jgi:hypothetical protein
MQALQIDWQAGPRRITLVGVALAVAALVCSAWVVLDYQQADDQWQSLQARQARQDRQARSGQAGNRMATAASPASPLARDEAQSAAHIDTQLQRPWDALLHAIERQSTKDVALISVDVQAASGSLHLVGEARDMAHALAYVKQLRQLPQLTKVYLTGQEEKLSGGHKVLRFALDASWSAAP